MLLQVFSYSEDFISHFEYGQMLYNSPRGVSCAKCHGKDGRGVVIASYLSDDAKRVYLSSPDIREVSLDKMIEMLNSSHDIMPKYYLTNQEITAIYDFIQESKKESQE
jgi:mono/diheme cytochrome c family protein